MNGELLLEWMTHIGTGSWPRLRETIRILCEPDDDIDAVVRATRSALSEFGHAIFDDDNHWTMHRPMLYTRPTRQDRSIWLGARTYRHLETVRELVSVCDATFESKTVEKLPHIVIDADADVLADIASAAGLTFVPNLTEHLASRLEPIQAMIERADAVAAPINWSARSFDPDAGRWIDGVRRGTVVEFTSPYNEKRWLFERRRHEWVQVLRRVGIYAACALSGTEAARYDVVQAELHVRPFAPLPSDAGRVAVICSGEPERRNGWAIYRGVPLQIASAILVSLNIRHPGIRWCA